MGKPKKWPVINYRYVPTIKKAKKKLGPFWFLLYDTCLCEPCICMQKVERAMKGDAWESPSDTMQGKVIMHPPYTRKYIQAEVHQKILEIGSEVEQKLRQEYEVDKQLALEQQEKGLSKEFHESIMERLKDAEAVEKTACFRELQAQAEEFENTLVDQIEELEEKMKMAFDEFSSAHQKELDEKLQEKLSLAAESTAKALTKRLLSELDIQKSIYQKYFDTKIMKKELEIDYNKVKHVNQLAQHLKIEKQRIECINITNMIYVLVMERRKCMNELEIIKERFTALKSQLNRKVTIQMEKIKQLEKELQNNMKQVFVRERCYKEILKQYQKFINYALKACPTQAQFLLSLEKLMSFDLAEILPQEKNPNYQGLPRLCDTILPWVHAGHDGKRRQKVAGLQLDDHHNCFNELAIPKVPGETEFPSFYYKNKLYVREDFRNLISQGIVLTPSHDMWSEDLEILMGILKDFSSDETVCTRRLDEVDVTEKSVDTHADLVQTKPILAPLTPKDKKLISEYIHPTPLVENPPYMIAVRNSLEFLQKRRGQREAAGLPDIAEAPKEEEDEEKVESVGDEDKPSFEEKIEKELKVDVPSDVESELKKLKQSEIEFRTSLSLESVVEDQRQSAGAAKAGEEKKLEDQKRPMEAKNDANLPVIMSPRMCRLANSRDSVAYLRESRQALLKPAPINVSPKREERRFPSLVPATEYCCEKCLKKRGMEMRPLDVKIVKGSREKVKTVNAEHPAKSSAVIETPDEKLASAEFYPNKLIDLYKEQDLRTKSRKFEAKKKVRRSKSVVDESKGQDVVVFDNDYTINRMKSFISSISEKPQLIKLFTACQR